MNKIKIIFLILVTTTALLISCSVNPPSQSSTLKALTESEQQKAIQIGLQTSEAKSYVAQGYSYKVERLDWVAIVWKDSHASEIYTLDNNVVDKGIPTNVPQTAVVYPQVELDFGEPPQILLRIAVDLKSGEAVDVEGFPLKIIPTQ